MVAKLGVRIEKEVEPLSTKPIKPARTPDIEASKQELFKQENEPLIPRGPGTGLRERKPQPRYVPDDWDDSLPYGGKVYLARKKKPDTIFCIGLQVLAVLFAVGLGIYAWFYTEHMHFHVTKAYAHIGYKDAQALIGHKLLNGKGVEQNHTEAMEWFKKASDQGHPHASYNVAVGHMQGMKTPLEQGEARRLIEHAAENGVPEAIEVLNKVCPKGHCDV